MQGFDCTTCSTFHPFSVYVLAHSKERLVHRCPVCSAEHELIEGTVTMKKPGDPAKANPPTPAPSVEPAAPTMADLFGEPAGPTIAQLIDTGHLLPAGPAPDMAALFAAPAPAAPSIAPEPTITPLRPPVVPAPWQPITATFPFDVDPLHDRIGWYEFVPRITAQKDVQRYWWNGEDWQTGPDGMPGDMRYDGYIGWRGLLAQGE